MLFDLQTNFSVTLCHAWRNSKNYLVFSYRRLEYRQRLYEFSDIDFAMHTSYQADLPSAAALAAGGSEPRTAKGSPEMGSTLPKPWKFFINTGKSPYP